MRPSTSTRIRRDDEPQVQSIPDRIGIFTSREVRREAEKRQSIPAYRDRHARLALSVHDPPSSPVTPQRRVPCRKKGVRMTVLDAVHDDKWVQQSAVASRLKNGYFGRRGCGSLADDLSLWSALVVLESFSRRANRRASRFEKLVSS